MSRVLRRVPFTLTMAAAIVAVAAWQGSLTGTLPPQVEYNWGLGLHSLWEGRAWTVLTSPFLTTSRLMVAAQMAMLAYSVGVCEYRLGSRRTVRWFWVSNVAGLWLAALLLAWPLWRAGVAVAVRTVGTSDTGASAGGVGCYGAWLGTLREPWRRRLWWLSLAILVGKTLLWPSLICDGGHLFGFLIGSWLARGWRTAEG